MAVTSQSYTIYSASATPIVIGDSITADGMTVWLHNDDGQQSHKIYVGGSGVTINNGVHLFSETTLGPIGLAPGEVLYAISDQVNGADLRVLAVRT